ncbi:MAG TPA: ATP phosphoribosyltransferase [Armatimonadota bacterium]|nr:ATP phosphoribosyltransferase [Armatimonadota bacterium]
MSTSQQLKIALPKGSLQESTYRLFERAGWKISSSSRSYFPRIDDPEMDAVLIRAQEIARYVQDGVMDCGLTGRDWVAENEADVVEVTPLVYSKQESRPVRWVVAVPNDSPINDVKDLQGKRIATELVNTTRNFLAEHGVNAHIEFSWGATEAKVPTLVDAIVDVTETGSSLRANNLRIMTTVIESVTVLIANKTAWEDPFKRQKIEQIAMLLQGALRANGKVGLKMNVPNDHIDKVIDLLPSMKGPTVSKLADDEWVAVETVIDEKTLREIIPQLKSAGAQDIIEYPLNKIIP